MNGKEVYTRVSDAGYLKNRELLYLLQDIGSGRWEFGLYDRKEGLVESYSIDDCEVGLNTKDKPLKKEGTKVEPLDAGSVNIWLEAAKSIAWKNFDDMDFKGVAILQNFNGKAVWNLTVIGRDMKTYNIRVDAVSGELIKKESIDLFKFN